MAPAARAWPTALAGSPAVAVIERAIERHRFAQSVLLQGDDSEVLAQLAYTVADRLLNAGPHPSPFPAERHPDCLSLRPEGKMRLIKADPMRALIGQVQVTPSIGQRKVVMVHEADRMNQEAANIFLKTLEEPPADTTLLLLTTRPYALLPTIRSRVIQFRFPSAYTPLGALGWAEWLQDYQAWLGRLADGVEGAKGAAAEVLTAYGLAARFALILERATDEAHERQKGSVAPGLEEEELEAIEANLSIGLRTRLLAGIEHATRTFAISRLAAGQDSVRRSFPAAIQALEHGVGLLRVNLNEGAVLEDFLLASLRLWAKR